MGKYLYGISVQGIQEYIFATNELKSIIGASQVIGNINQRFNDEKYKEHVVINAAGNIKLLFNTKEEFAELVKETLKEIKQNAFGITVSQAVHCFEDGDLKNAFNALERKLAISRNQPEIPIDSSINLLKLAPKSAKPLVENDKDMATIQKEAQYRYDQAFGSIGNIKNRKNKIAIIHADGNQLGAKIAAMSKELKDDEEVRRTYRDFSEKLDTATREAVEAAKESLPDIKLREVILGGDDLTVICDANHALEFTNRFLALFEEKTKKLLGGDGLTACAGIAYCNHKYPFHYAVDLAESLCKEAKTHSRNIDVLLPPSSIMFHNIQSSNFTSYEDYKDTELTINRDDDRVRLNYGPYFIHAQKAYAKVEDFRNLANALNVKGSPLSRLREWLTILGESRKAADMRLERINQMMELKNKLYNKDALNNALQRFNSELSVENLLYRRGEELYTPIYDITSYLSVIDEGKKRVQEDAQHEV